jgi:hypothetical protein
MPPGAAGSSQGVNGPGGPNAGCGVAPIADTQGVDWALPKATPTSTAVLRPIYIACLSDQLVILPEKGDPSPYRAIAAPGPFADVMDEFVSAIWEHMDQWGLAVAGGYWKPVLHVEVGRGAEPRFEELRTLLENSGFDMKRKAR